MHVRPLVPTLTSLDLTRTSQPVLHWARVFAGHAAATAAACNEADAAERCRAAEQHAARRLQELAAPLQPRAAPQAASRTPHWQRLGDVQQLQPGSKCCVVGVVNTAQGTGGVVARATKSGRTAYTVDITDPGCPGLVLRVAFEGPPPKRQGPCSQGGGTSRVCCGFRRRFLIPPCLCCSHVSTQTVNQTCMVCRWLALKRYRCGTAVGSGWCARLRKEVFWNGHQREGPWTSSRRTSGTHPARNDKMVKNDRLFLYFGRKTTTSVIATVTGMMGKLVARETWVCKSLCRQTNSADKTTTCLYKTRTLLRCICNSTSARLLLAILNTRQPQHGLVATTVVSMSVRCHVSACA